MLYLKASEYGIRDLYFQAQHGIKVLGKEFVIDEWLLNKNTEQAKRKCRQYLESNIVCILVEFSDRFGIYLDLDENMDLLVSHQTVTFNVAEKIRENQAPSRANFVPQQRSNINNDEDKVISLNSVRQKPTRTRPTTNTRPPRLGTTTLPPRPSTTTRPPVRHTAPPRPSTTTRPAPVQNQAIEISGFAQLSNLVEKLAGNLDAQSEKQFRLLLSQRLIFEGTVVLQILKQSFLESVGPIADLIYQEVMEDLGKVETFGDFELFFEMLAAEIEEPSYQQKFRENISEKLIFDVKVALGIVCDSLQESVGPIGKTIYQDVINGLL